MTDPTPTADIFIHRILVRFADVDEAIERLSTRGIFAQVSGYDYAADKAAIDWMGESQRIDLDFLRPDILPPRKEQP